MSTFENNTLGVTLVEALSGRKVNQPPSGSVTLNGQAITDDALHKSADQALAGKTVSGISVCKQGSSIAFFIEDEDAPIVLNFSLPGAHQIIYISSGIKAGTTMQVECVAHQRIEDDELGPVSRYFVEDGDSMGMNAIEIFVKEEALEKEGSYQPKPKLVLDWSEDHDSLRQTHVDVRLDWAMEGYVHFSYERLPFMHPLDTLMDDGGSHYWEDGEDDDYRDIGYDDDYGDGGYGDPDDYAYMDSYYSNRGYFPETHDPVFDDPKD